MLRTLMLPERGMERTIADVAFFMNTVIWQFGSLIIGLVLIELPVGSAPR